ncbi:MAG: hypothetical protein ACOC5S_05095 [Acidobacteriota bacterium]
MNKRQIILGRITQEDIRDWKSKSPEEKLDAVQELREIYYEINHESRN